MINEIKLIYCNWIRAGKSFYEKLAMEHDEKLINKEEAKKLYPENEGKKYGFNK